MSTLLKIMQVSREVQSMHFGASRDKVTIQDGVIYVQNKALTFAAISNCLRNHATAVWT
jgi:hypothetical protein